VGNYDLRCRSCGEDFEVFCQGFLKDDAKVCPDCGSQDVEQQLTGGFLMGGSAAGSGVSLPLGGGASSAGSCSHSFG
jgi:putative FmdB family regulatory protein